MQSVISNARSGFTARIRAVIKRLIDVVVSGAALVALSPVLLVLAVAIRSTLGSPVLFRQVRPGFKGKPFTMLKFRTMRETRDINGNSLPDEQRLFPFGRWLRSTSLDELPALWCVLRGDMSLVGPRPLLAEYLPLYTREQARRHDVRPGITGWAQVNGRNALSWPERFALDVWYVDHHSLRLDFRILWVTLLKVFTQEGISQRGHATMPKFTGQEQ